MTKTRTKTVEINRNINLAQSETNLNYWSPLTCLVEEQEKMMEKIANSKSEKEMQIFLKQNGPVAEKKHWTEIWNKNSENDWFQTQYPHIPLTKPYRKPVEQAPTEISATPIPAHTARPPVSSEIEEENINQKVIHHMSEI